MIVFSRSIWKYFPNTGKITGAYIIFYQDGPIGHCTHVPVPMAQSSAESEYNVACTAGMVLANFRMFIHKLLNKDPDIVPYSSSLIILDSKSAVCMSNNVKDNKHTRHVARRVNFVINSKNCKMHRIEWFEGGFQLSEIATKNVGDTDLNPRIKYSMVRLDI